MGVDFHWNKGISQICSGIVDKDTQLFMANEAKKLMEPYVPSMNQNLTRNVRVYAENGKGIVHYMSVYANYQREGNVMVDPITGNACFSDSEGHKWSRKGAKKVKTNKKLVYTKFRHPLATSQWDKAMMTARGDDLAASIQRYIGKRG